MSWHVRLNEGLDVFATTLSTTHANGMDRQEHLCELCTQGKSVEQPLWYMLERTA